MLSFFVLFWNFCIHIHLGLHSALNHIRYHLQKKSKRFPLLLHPFVLTARNEFMIFLSLSSIGATSMIGFKISFFVYLQIVNA